MDFVCVNRSSKPGEQEDHRRTDNNKDDHDKKHRALRRHLETSIDFNGRPAPGSG